MAYRRGRNHPRSMSLGHSAAVCAPQIRQVPQRRRMPAELWFAAGHVADLMALRLRVVAEQHGSTVPTKDGAELPDLLNLLERLERTTMSCMAGLSARLTSRSGALRSGRSRGRICRGWLGRVARVLVEPFFQFHHPLLQLRAG